MPRDIRHLLLHYAALWSFYLYLSLLEMGAIGTSIHLILLTSGQGNRRLTRAPVY